MNDNPLIRFAHEVQPSAPEDAAVGDLTPREHAALRNALDGSPLAVLLEAAGHSRACILRVRSGRGLGCSCEVAAEPLSDAATVIGLALQFARAGAFRRIPIPHGVLSGLVEQVDAGNAAAILVWQWLARRGQIPAQSELRPKLHVVCERSR